ncbi:MAG: hypothetical protein ABJL67_06205 [Sulfitobacter sp.]
MRLTAIHPGRWIVGISVLQIPLMYSLWLVPPVWALFLYPLFFVALVPAYLAASKNSKAQTERRHEAWRRVKHVQALIKMGRKRG